MSERTPMDALRSALRFAASRSCITSAEELAIMDAWNNTRPQPSADPVAEQVWNNAWQAAKYAGTWSHKDTGLVLDLSHQAATAVIASALEAARREALEEAAKVADQSEAECNRWQSPCKWTAREIRRAIIALKENPNAG